MKKLFQIISVIILGSILIRAQEPLIEGELSFDIINNNGSLVEIEYELISPVCWHAPDHYITELFNGGTQTKNQNRLLEFLACWETTASQYFRTFGLGYYKFTAKVNGITKDYFYIDYRTSTLPENYNPQGDIRIEFNVATGILYYYLNQTEFPTFTTIWEEKPHVGVSTSELPNFWQNSLVVVSSENNNPRFVWGPNPDFENILGYKIYRAVHWVPNPKPIVYSLIATVNNDIFNYIDTQVLMGDWDYLWYYVTAYNSETESTGSNVVTTRAGFYKKNNFDKLSSTSYGLKQNYPNPFNPSTTISFSLAENSFITLKVYDVLGKEVITIINEMLEAGVHQVEFDGSGLNSGVYFYEIRAGNFRDTKKLILLK